MRSHPLLPGILLGMLLVAAAAVRPLAAQSTGKVTGTVTDAATGETLPGVSVYLEEDRFVGTTTDDEGRYFLLGVPPGRFTLVMSYVGFATLKQANVEVFSGRTTTVDGRLREEVLEGEEIVVSADRPLVVRDRTTTVSFVEQETIERLPVQEVSDLIRFQPGVVAGTDGFHFRGGRTRETAYLIDGIPVQNVFDQGGGNTVDLEVQSVQELQVFTGTFDAEFGGAQSGVVSVTTRDPGAKWAGTVRGLAGGYYAGGDDPFIGGDRFDPVGTKDVTLTLSGPLAGRLLGLFVTGRYEDRTGYLKGERRFNPEDGFKIDTYRRWYRDVYQPDDTRLIALDTARMPAGEYVLGRDGSPLTFATGDGEVVDMDWSRTLTLNPKLVFRPTSRLQLTYAALFNREESQWLGAGCGDARVDCRRYAPDFRPVSYERELAHIVSARHTFGSAKVLTLRGSYKVGDHRAYAFDAMDDPRLQFVSAEDDVTGFSLGATSNDEAHSRERQLILSGDFLWQVNDRNELKTGVFFRNNTFTIDDLDRSWVYPDARDSLFLNLDYPPALAFASFDDYFDAVKAELPVLVPELARYAVDDRFHQSPVELAVYVQDKLEFDTRLVLKAGLRGEYFDVRQQKLVDPRTPTDRIGRADNFADTRPKYYLSPRLGLSYPISATGAFRVAYGHFVQMPAYRELFKNPVFAGINVGRLADRRVGNPDLQPERTIKYEIGLQQQVTGFVGVDVNLFYKNVRNLLGTEILTTLDNVQYFRTVNRDYGLVKGATLAFVMRPVGPLLHASFDVTYTDARGSASDANDVAEVVTAGRSGEEGEVFLERNIIPLDWDQRYTANASATVGRAGDWSVGVIAQLASGQPYTPAFLDPNLRFPDNEFLNAERKPSVVRLDLSAEKRFYVGRLAYGLRVQVDNVFNQLSEHTVDAISGRAGQIVRLPVVQADRVRVLDYANLFTPEEADTNPARYGAPRRILFSVTLTF